MDDRQYVQNFALLPSESFTSEALWDIAAAFYGMLRSNAAILYPVNDSKWQTSDSYNSGLSSALYFERKGRFSRKTEKLHTTSQTDPDILWFDVRHAKEQYEKEHQTATLLGVSLNSKFVDVSIGKIGENGRVALAIAYKNGLRIDASKLESWFAQFTNEAAALEEAIKIAATSVTYSYSPIAEGANPLQKTVSLEEFFRRTRAEERRVVLETRDHLFNIGMLPGSYLNDKSASA